MNTVTNKEYSNDLTRFINKHSMKAELVEIKTSAYIDGQYSKKYLFEDGATFFEINRSIKVQTTAEAHGIKFDVDVAMIEHEYWSTDDSQSKYWFEKA